MSSDEFDIRAALNLLKRQSKLIIVTIALALALAGLALAALSPVYTSSTLLVVDPRGIDALTGDAATSSSVNENARIEGEAEIIRSDAVLLDVIARGGLGQDPEFGRRVGPLAQARSLFLPFTNRANASDTAERSALAQLRRALTVQRHGMTYLISVSVQSENPQKAAQLSNLVAETYIHHQVTRKVEAVLASQSVLDSRLNEVRRAVVASESNLDSFISNYIDETSDQGITIQAALLQSRLRDITRERDLLLEQARQLDTNLASADWAGLLNAIDTDDTFLLLEDREGIVAALQAVEPESETALGLRAELEEIEASIAAHSQQATQGLREQASSLQAETARLRQQIRSTVVSSDLPADALTSVFELQQAAELARLQYQALMERSNDLRLQAHTQLADARVVSEAMPPSAPSFPNPVLFIGAALVLGAAAGVGLGYLRENFVGGVTSSEQAVDLFKTPNVVEVPRYLVQGNSPTTAVIAAPVSIYSESIRRIRASIDRSLRQLKTGRAEERQEPPIMLVTSALPGDGKTTIALSLARVYALAGHKTLLIDCDLRKPAVHTYIDVGQSDGLLDLLNGKAQIEYLDQLVQVDPSGLHILTSTRPPQASTDQLLTSANFEKVLNAGRSRYEIIVLDTPPLEPIVDTIYLARHATAAVFVLRWAATAQKDAQRAFEQLRLSLEQEVPSIIVLNQFQFSRAKSSYYAEYFDED
ncbi:GumC family protein [Pelagibacterium lentulum]|uniref:non-specific protein-tyrosine kinase n=1 Tax=Pelagibacterium lentulum TaxID=2029865 RepID=A0A916VUN3_9HYPH|nr:polysaccharide biosynthesis tyrosine autokinase [Pelagibacterium lentulum]GGA36304.1 hypothetical protein GCM10011499_02070 [Pelagibacterium lentulum]